MEEEWKELLEVVESFAPVRTLTTKLQDSTLNSGQTLGHWQLTMLSLEPISTPLATNANGTHEITYENKSVSQIQKKISQIQKTIRLQSQAPQIEIWNTVD